MALTIQMVASHTIASDAAMQQIISKDSTTINDNTSCTVADSGQRAVLPLANVLLVADGVTTSRLVSVTASGAFNLRFGAVDADPVAVVPMSSGQSAVFQATVTAASVYVQNPSASAQITVRWAIAGV